MTLPVGEKPALKKARGAEDTGGPEEFQMSRSSVAHMTDHSRDVLASAARMLEAAMPSQRQQFDDALLLDFRLQEHRRLTERLREACRLTEQWMNEPYRGRGNEPSVSEIAAVAIGYERELAREGYPRSGDPYVVIDHVPYYFHADPGGWFWSRTIPDCPVCPESLNVTHSRRVHGVECDPDGTPIAIVCWCSARIEVRR